MSIVLRTKVIDQNSRHATDGSLFVKSQDKTAAGTSFNAKGVFIEISSSDYPHEEERKLVKLSEEEIDNLITALEYHKQLTYGDGI